MFAALGVGAFTAAIFHLMAHGFFKGLLFLGSGSVIHAVHEEQDMNNMGGLWRKIPVTHWTMLIGTLAIAGIPPLAGFFSKDEILGESFKFGFYWVWAIGLVVAVMTAFYMWRLMGKTFYGAAVGVREADLGPDPRVDLDDDRARSSSWPSPPRSSAWPWACRSGTSRISAAGWSRSSPSRRSCSTPTRSPSSWPASTAP